MAVVLPVPLWALQKFAADAALPPAAARRLYADTTGALFAAAGCTVKFDSRSKFTSMHAQTTVAQATVRGFWLVVSGGGLQGDPRQQGGAWVLEATPRGGGGGGGGEITTVWSHYDRHNADQVPIPVLLAAAGAPASLYVHPRPVTAAAQAASGSA
jgi:hypothetical protein